MPIEENEERAGIPKSVFATLIHNVSGIPNQTYEKVVQAVDQGVFESSKRVAGINEPGGERRPFPARVCREDGCHKERRVNRVASRSFKMRKKP